jgi:TnsA endonuclease C terminal
MEPVLASNVSWVHAYREAAALFPLTDKVIRRVEAVLTPRVNKEQSPLRDLTDACDDQLGLSPGSSLSVVRHLIANKRWQVDIKQTISMARPLAFLTAATCGKKEGKK